MKLKKYNIVLKILIFLITAKLSYIPDSLYIKWKIFHPSFDLEHFLSLGMCVTTWLDD